MNKKQLLIKINHKIKRYKNHIPYLRITKSRQKIQPNNLNNGQTPSNRTNSTKQLGTSYVKAFKILVRHIPCKTKSSLCQLCSGYIKCWIQSTKPLLFYNSFTPKKLKSFSIPSSSVPA